MATFAETVTNLRDWCDRDSTILSDAVVKKFLTFAADKAYGTLRIPAFETSADFTVASSDIIANPSNTGGQEITITAPSDLIELIYVQKKGEGIVWNSKVDSRTFHDRYADKTNFNFYTRVGDKFLFHGNFATGDVLEVHYYRRLQALDALYAINTSNYLSQTTLGITTMTGSSSSGGSTGSLYFESSASLNSINGVGGATRPTAVSTTSTGTTTTQIYMTGAEQPNWLRDQNEKIILYGGLAEAYDYLEENELSTRFEKRFYDEIDRLNGEEQRRIAKGGNISMSFSANGLI